METSEKWGVWGLFVLFGGILVGTMYQNSNQNSRLTAMETFADVTGANKKYLAEFGKQVKAICTNYFVNKDVYKADLTAMQGRLKKLEPQSSAGTTGAPQSASAVPPNAPENLETPAAPIANVTSQASKPNDPAVVGASQVQPQPVAVTAGSCDCNELKGQLDQVNQKLDQIHGKLGGLPDKNWQTNENKRVMDDLKFFLKSFISPSESPSDAPPPPVEPRPTVIPRKQESKTQVREKESVPLRNLNLAQSGELHEEFVGQWAYNGICYHKFVLKDTQGRIHGQPFSRPIGQQVAYRLW